jgi:hypothetical protein
MTLSIVIRQPQDRINDAFPRSGRVRLPILCGEVLILSGERICRWIPRCGSKRPAPSIGAVYSEELGDDPERLTT